MAINTAITGHSGFEVAERMVRRGQRMAPRPATSPGRRSCADFLYWIKAARLRRAARAGGPWPPPLHVSATAPAAPRRSARSIAKADSWTRKQLDHSEHQDQAETDQVRPRRPTGHAPQPDDRRGAGRAQASGGQVDNVQAGMETRAVTHEGSVAEVGRGLLETHVTGAQSAPPPSWLTFGGSGPSWASIGRTATVIPSDSTTRGRGCRSRTHVRACQPPRYHRHRGPDQGFRDRTTPHCCPG